jgi:Tol biopolymer transport system component
MTLDTRARRAALGIRRAVEVMEMSTSTKEPRKVERFDRFRDRKQRNRRIGALLVAAILTIAVIVVASVALQRRDTTLPVTPPRNGRIVFGEAAGRHRPRVYTMNPDGTDIRALSVTGYATEPDGSPRTITDSTSATSHCMSWSPDGSKIIIQHQSIGGLAVGPGLASINPDGTGYAELDQSVNRCGSASPDGTRSIVAGHHIGLGTGVYSVRASDGGDPVRLANFRGEFAVYSPDSSRVAFTPIHNRAYMLSDRASGLWVVNADGTDLHLIAHSYAIRPSWSPDGRWLVFETTSDGAAVYVVHADGTGLRRVALETVPRLRAAIYPSWSPDSTRIVFVGFYGSGEENLFTARRDGTDVQQVTHTRGVSYVSPEWGTNGG